MKTIDEAVRNYEDGVRNFGIENYRKCGNEKGWYNVAKCLHEAKKTKEVSLDLMVKRYKEAAT